jgi:signal transduction histidine kinase
VPRRTELLVGVAGAVFGACAIVASGGTALALAGGTVAGGALGATRRHPRATWMVAVAAFLALAADVDADDSLAVLVLVPLHAFCAARWDRGWGAVAAIVGLVFAWELALLVHSDDAWVPAVLIPGTLWAAGRALREREQVAAQLGERARELEEEREAYATLSVRYERARIASELHDIVAHALSVMVIQATAGQRLVAHDAEATAQTFEAIADAARQAEQDMGRLVALLGDEEAIGPAPDLILVEELVARAAGSGLDVRLRLEGDREGLRAPLGQTAYRVVQEGLTNALRYAAGAAVAVRVRGGGEALVVEVENAPASDEGRLAGVGTGNGLRGLRERVGACGGTLEAGPTADGGWLLAARLPRRVLTSSASPTSR